MVHGLRRTLQEASSVACRVSVIHRVSVIRCHDQSSHRHARHHQSSREITSTHYSSITETPDRTTHSSILIKTASPMLRHLIRPALSNLPKRSKEALVAFPQQTRVFSKVASAGTTDDALVETEIDNHIATLILNRPPVNSLSLEM